MSEPIHIGGSVQRLMGHLLAIQDMQPACMRPQPEDYDAKTGELIRDRMRTEAQLAAMRVDGEDMTEVKASRDELRFAATVGAKMSDEQWAAYMQQWKADRLILGLRQPDRGQKVQRVEHVEPKHLDSVTYQVRVLRQAGQGSWEPSGKVYCYVDLETTHPEPFSFCAGFWGDDGLTARTLVPGDLIYVSGPLIKERGRMKMKGASYMKVTQ